MKHVTNVTLIRLRKFYKNLTDVTHMLLNKTKLAVMH